MMINPDKLESWAVPNLTFLRIESVSGSSRVGEENAEHSQQSPQQNGANPALKRSYLMEDALIGLHSQSANLSFLVLGTKTGVSHFFGASLPIGTEVDMALGQVQQTFSIVDSVLQSIYGGVDINEHPFDADQIKALIAARSNHIGVMTGFPSLKSSGGDAIDSTQIEGFSNGLHGQEFGFLTLAVPIPKRLLTKEESGVINQIQKAQENKEPEKRRRIKYFLELQKSYLKHVQLGTTVGSWQVGTYFFATDRSVFDRLQSLLQITYSDQTSGPTALRTQEMNGLKPHLERFGLLRSARTDRYFNSLFAYEFLTPLNSRALSAYMHLPER